MRTAALALAACLTSLFSGCSISRNFALEDAENRRDRYRAIDGDIDIGANTRTGSAKTIDGDITIINSLVEGAVRTAFGSVRLDDSTVNGTIVVERARDPRDAISTVEIGPDCDVHSIVIKESPSKVRLLIHVAAEVESIEGAEPEYFGAQE